MSWGVRGVPWAETPWARSWGVLGPVGPVGTDPGAVGPGGARPGVLGASWAASSWARPGAVCGVVPWGRVVRRRRVVRRPGRRRGASWGPCRVRHPGGARRRVRRASWAASCRRVLGASCACVVVSSCVPWAASCVARRGGRVSSCAASSCAHVSRVVVVSCVASWGVVRRVCVRRVVGACRCRRRVSCRCVVVHVVGGVASSSCVACRHVPNCVASCACRDVANCVASCVVVRACRNVRKWNGPGVVS